MSNWVTPIGKALWPHINEPDTKFDEDGVFTISLVLPDEEAQPLIERLEERYGEEYGSFCRERKKTSLKEADKPWQAETDEEGNLTGNSILRFKMKAKTAKGIEQRPLIFDAKKRPMTEVIGGGSQIKVAFEPSCWFVPALGVGISLRLRGVQVIKLMQPRGSSPESMGFDEEEGFETAAAMLDEPTGDSSGDF